MRLSIPSGTLQKMFTTPTNIHFPNYFPHAMQGIIQRISSHCLLLLQRASLALIVYFRPSITRLHGPFFFIYSIYSCSGAAESTSSYVRERGTADRLLFHHASGGLLRSYNTPRRRFLLLFPPLNYWAIIDYFPSPRVVLSPAEFG